VQGADPAIVGPYLASVLADDRWRECTVTHISGGKSNLTYAVASPAGEVILRRPPLGHVLPTAHDMGREYTVMTALRDTAVPVPTTLHHCTDESVLGAPFYVMERVAGFIVREEFPPGYADSPEDKRRVGDALIDVLVALHAVDAEAVGLGSFGRPDGYLERQLRRWGQQWEATRVVEAPDLDALFKRLSDVAPDSPPSTIVHGDYRLDNTLLAPDDPGRIAAVLDWEMSTRGDPLADLGILLVYWTEPGDDSDADRMAAVVVPSATRLPGFPSRTEVTEAYAARSGRDVSTLPWYVAFAFLKLAVVCAGIVARAKAGAMVGEGFLEAEARIAPLTALGHRVLDRGGL